MANICDNKLYLTSEENTDKWEKELLSFLDNNSFQYYNLEMNDSWLEVNFESKWTFPSKLYDFGKNGEEDGLYIRCLSEEYGCGYVAMNIYDGGKWFDEQCFNL